MLESWYWFGANHIRYMGQVHECGIYLKLLNKSLLKNYNGLKRYGRYEYVYFYFIKFI